MLPTGSAVLWTSSTSLALQVRHTFTPKNKCTSKYFRCWGGFYPNSNISNAVNKFFISFFIPSLQYDFPFRLSSWYTCLTERGSSTPCLCVFFRSLAFTEAITQSRFLRVKSNHQAKYGSSSIQFNFKSSATSMGLDSLISFKGIQVWLPSFQLTRNDHPFVVICLERLTCLSTTYASLWSRSEPSLR